VVKNSNRIIFYILLLALLLRLYHITFPVSGWHSWRQSDTAAIARNFYENGYKLLYPQVDWGGGTPGYVESEFQIYPFFVALLYSVFGVNDMWGRMLSVIFSLVTIYMLYLFVRKIITDKVALWSALIYAVLPLNIYYSRAFMPESAMLMCSVFGIYYFYKWFEEDKNKFLYISAIFISFAVLLKLPCSYLGLPLFYLAYRKYGFHLFKKYFLWLFVLIIFVPAVLWYNHAHQLYVNGGVSFSIWNFGEDKWGTFGLLIKPSFYNDIFFKSIAERLLLYPGFILFIWGLFIKRQNDNERLFDFWLLSIFIFILIVSQGNLRHEYYQLPFVLPAVVYAGKVFSKYVRFENLSDSFKEHKFQFIILGLCIILIPVLSYLRYSNFMRSENYDSALFKLTNEVKTLTNDTDLVITASDNNPVYLYLSHRKGWAVGTEQIGTAFINQRKIQGAKWIFGEKSAFNSEKSEENLKEILKTYRTIRNENDYFIVRLEKN
jgi:4-amino-4-deoxy-L-arabinose transferase-like glycosyltransferase